jgi:hypothetical protein
MYPASTLIATLTADRLREAEAARVARAAGRLRSMPARRSRPVRATIIHLAVLASAGYASRGRDRVRP